MIRRTGPWTLGAGLLVVGLLAAPGARAFNTLKAGLNDARWPADSMPIGWEFYEEGAGIVGDTEAVQASFDAWEAVEGATITFRYLGETDRSGALDEDGHNQVEWIEENWDPAIGGDALAVCPTFRYVSGEIYESGVAFNGEEYLWSTRRREGRQDIQAIGTHEIGHWLGLDHSVQRDAVMYWAGGGADARRELTDDDIRGVTYLYPQDDYSGGQVCDSCLTGADCGGVDDSCVGIEDGAFCGRACAGPRDCDEGQTCFDLAGDGSSQCLPAGLYCSQDGGQVELGGYCWGHETCRSRVCLVTSDSAYCSEVCPAGRCPDGYECLGRGVSAVCAQPGEGQIGDPCRSHTDCEDLTCAALVGDEGQCTKACDGEGAPCPAGSSCTPTGLAGWYCTPGERGTYATDCSDSDECVSEICLLVAAGVKVCSQVCDPESNPCPDGSPCRNHGDRQVCIPGGKSREGEACAEHEDCDGDLVCFDDGEGATCHESCEPLGVKRCSPGLGCRLLDVERGACVELVGDEPGATCQETPDSCRAEGMCLRAAGSDTGSCFRYCSTEEGGRPECPGGRSCFGLGEDDAPLGICPSGDGEPGTNCTSFDDCSSGMCLVLEDGAVCSQRCAVTEPDCPDDMDCVEGLGGGLCVPASTELPPDAALIGLDEGAGEGEGEGEGGGEGEGEGEGGSGGDGAGEGRSSGGCTLATGEGDDAQRSGALGLLLVVGVALMRRRWRA